jgi:hypothetical protein
MAMKFTIYTQSTGQVLFSGTADNPNMLAAEGQAVLLDEAFTDGYIQDGQHFTLPAQPGPHHVFDYTTKEWEDPRTAEAEWPLVRAKRDELLTQTDWVAARAYERGEPVPQNYVVYRQALRDITNQPDPFNITWPVLENAQ